MALDVVLACLLALLGLLTLPIGLLAIAFAVAVGASARALWQLRRWAWIVSVGLLLVGLVLTLLEVAGVALPGARSETAALALALLSNFALLAYFLAVGPAFGVRLTARPMPRNAATLALVVFGVTFAAGMAGGLPDLKRALVGEVLYEGDVVLAPNETFSYNFSTKASSFTVHYVVESKTPGRTLVACVPLAGLPLEIGPPEWDFASGCERTSAGAPVLDASRSFNHYGEPGAGTFYLHCLASADGPCEAHVRVRLRG